MRASRGLLMAVITVAATVSCGGDDSSETAAGPPDTGPTTVTSAPASSTVQPGAAIPSQAVPPLGEVRLKLTKVADLDEPLALALREGDDAFYVAEKGGRVRAVGGGGEVADGAVLDLSGEVSTGSEQGLLGIAFSPDGSKLYASFTNSGGDSRLWEYA
ncbi:MAG: hypothetical protein ACRDY7_14715, partial [Acidimicrobiia bacterium]